MEYVITALFFLIPFLNFISVFLFVFSGFRLVFEKQKTMLHLKKNALKNYKLLQSHFDNPLFLFLSTEKYKLSQEEANLIIPLLGIIRQMRI